ncbi:hypothetical protein ABZP36_031792 [Zizania latifolia]
MATVSAQGLLRQDCKSFILYPGKPCDLANCTKMYNGTGTCFSPSFGCDCEYCPSSSTNSTGSTN